MGNKKKAKAEDKKNGKKKVAYRAQRLGKRR